MASLYKLDAVAKANLMQLWLIVYGSFYRHELKSGSNAPFVRNAELKQVPLEHVLDATGEGGVLV